MLTFKRHRFAAAIATAAVTAIVVLTSGSFGAVKPMDALAETVSTADTKDMAKTIHTSKASGTGPGFVINTKLNLSGVDAQTLKEGKTLTGNLIEQSVQKQMEKDALIKEQNEKNMEILQEQEKQAELERRAAELGAGSGINCSAEDYNTLLKIVQAEAGICDQKGKILVANVIINRVKSSKFPNTVTSVVYQKKQFSPVSNGRINQVTVTQDTVECVNRALAGEDYSQGALYFMNRGRSRSGAVGWFDRSLTYLFSHDGHEFFR